MEESMFLQQTYEGVHVAEDLPVHSGGYKDPSTANENSSLPTEDREAQGVMYHLVVSPTVNKQTMHRPEDEYSTWCGNSHDGSPAEPVRLDDTPMSDLLLSSFDQQHQLPVPYAYIMGPMATPTDEPWSHLRVGTPMPRPASYTPNPEGRPPEPSSSYGQSSTCETRSTSDTTPLSSIEGENRMCESAMTLTDNMQPFGFAAMPADNRGYRPGNDGPAPDVTLHLSGNDPVQEQEIDNPDALNSGPWGLRHQSLETASSSSYPQSHRQPDGQLQCFSSTARSPVRWNEHSICCDVCGKMYSGEYGRGNLARHKRQKHGNTEQVFPCEDPDCRKEFRRQDARLKHYRRRHPYLAPGPPVPRPH